MCVCVCVCVCGVYVCGVCGVCGVRVCVCMWCVVCVCVCVVGGGCPCHTLIANEEIPAITCRSSVDPCKPLSQ